jgi:TPR repeat protein
MNFKRLSWGQLGAVVAINALILLPQDGGGDTPVLECTRLSELPDDGTPLALVMQAPESKKVEPGRAEAACRAALATDPANPNFMFQLARALTLGKKPLEAIKYYLDAADRGHAGAMNDLAGVFEYGLGLPKNLATAVDWYQRAGELGHGEAMSHLGQLSENGLGMPQDFAKARQWYEKAATLGNAGSMNSLGDLLRKQGGLPLAAQWYVKAARDCFGRCLGGKRRGSHSSISRSRRR